MIENYAKLLKFFGLCRGEYALKNANPKNYYAFLKERKAGRGVWDKVGVNLFDFFTNIVKVISNFTFQKRELKIYNLIKFNPTISASELTKDIKVSHRTVQRDLVRLQKKGLLKREGPDKGGKWIINIVK